MPHHLAEQADKIGPSRPLDQELASTWRHLRAHASQYREPPKVRFQLASKAFPRGPRRPFGSREI